MLNGRLIKLMVCLLFIGILPGIGLTEAKDVKPIEPKLIMEYKFDEPVVDIIWDEATMTVKEARALGVKGLEQRKATEIVKVQYPAVIFIAKDDKKPLQLPGLNYGNFPIPEVKLIKFLNEKGMVRKEIQVQQYISGKTRAADIVVSENRKYLCVTTVKKESKKGYVIEAESIILNTKGDKLWSVNHSLGHVIVSPNGRYVIGTDIEWGGTPIQVFYNNGAVKEIKKDDQCWDVKFSKEGEFFALASITIDWQMPVKNHIERYRKHLIVMNDKGNELWRKENIAQGDSAIWSEITKITHDNIIIFTIFQPILKVYYFDKEGNLINEK